MKKASGLPSYPLFDWLRFGLASIVALSHFGVVTWIHAGDLAVQVFFALSGWLIGGILVGGEPKSLPHFYYNRVTRIWLPYFAAVIALYAFSASRDPINRTWVSFLLHDLTFTKNWFTRWPYSGIPLDRMPLGGTGTHFWSLSVEEQFYLAAPLVMYATRFGRSPIVWAALTFALLLFGQTDFASIAAGVSAASIRRRVGDWHLAQLSVAGAGFAFATTLALMVADFGYGYVAPIFSIATILLCAREGRRLSLGVFLGGVSYPLYLNHWMGGYIAHAITRHIFPGLKPMDGYLAYALGLALGAVAFLAIDRNVMARRRDWYRRQVGVACGIAAYALLALGLLIGFAEFI